MLTVVDVFSKYLWARPLKNKSAEEVKEAFSRIFKERRPIVLQTDNSNELKNTVLANYLLLLWGITQVFSKAYAPTTQGMVEWYNQTLKHKPRLNRDSRRETRKRQRKHQSFELEIL